MSNFFCLRLMTGEDLDQVFSWRNHPRIISLSTSQRAITYAEHLVWFDRVLASVDVAAFIVEVNGLPAGHIRVDKVSDSDGVITVYLNPEFSGRGIGVSAIRRMCEKAYEKWPTLNKVIACVRDTNDAGLMAFRKAGFYMSDRQLCSECHVELVKERGGRIV